MSKSIQTFEAWGYVVEPNAKGYNNIKFPADEKDEKHCNIYHPDAVDPMIPITTFSITGDKNILKIARAFNDSWDHDRRPRNQKLRTRHQIVSYWSLVENRDLKDLKQIVYLAVIERNLRDRMEEVYEMKELDEFDGLTLKASDPAFQLLLSNTPFLAGAQKMLNEYADMFAGKKIQSCTFDPWGGFAVFDFAITLN